MLVVLMTTAVRLSSGRSHRAEMAQTRLSRILHYCPI